ncbi:MAG: hypothetical protein LBJ12_01700 [Oscillospiraceae bacterium]|nr:hypothetical protein [Oscillospiraceae bacterium]
MCFQFLCCDFRAVAEAECHFPVDADHFLTATDKEVFYPQYLEYLEHREEIRQKNAVLDAALALPIAERRATLAPRIADFLNGLNEDARYLNAKLIENGLEEIADVTNAEQIEAILADPLQTQKLTDAMKGIAGASSGVFERKHGYRFHEELTALFERRPVYNLGGKVYVGSKEYEVLSFDESTVRLFDTEFPLLNKELSRAELDRKVAENPQNEHLMMVVAEQPKQTARDVFDEYSPLVVGKILFDEAYMNARANSDEQNSRTECEAAVERIALEISMENTDFLRAYSDEPWFKQKLIAHVFQKTYTALAVDPTESTAPEPSNSIQLIQNGGLFEAYGDDARILAEVFGFTVIQKNNRDMVGFPSSQLDENLDVLVNDHGYTVGVDHEPLTPDYTTSPREMYEQSLDEEPYTPQIGDKHSIDGRMFEVDSVSADSPWRSVSLRDITFDGVAGFPIFRRESLDFIRQYEPIAEQTADPEALAPAKPVG